jgi:hypothetical protein
MYADVEEFSEFVGLGESLPASARSSWLRYSLELLALATSKNLDTDLTRGGSKATSRK